MAPSPDGKWLLWARQIDGKVDLWRMPLDGSGDEEQITFTETEQEGGAFYMPDSETVLYRSWERSAQGQRGMPRCCRRTISRSSCTTSRPVRRLA